MITSGWASLTTRTPSGAATNTNALILVQPFFLSISMVATIEPPVANIGSMIRAGRLSIWLTNFSKNGTGCKVSSSRCKPTTEIFAVGIKSSTPSNMPIPARKIGTIVAVLPMICSPVISPHQPCIGKVSISKSRLASYAIKRASSLVNVRNL